MDDLVLADVREKLLKLRAELEAVASTSDESSQIVELDQARVGRLSRMDALQAQAMAQESGRRREIMLRRISVALERVERGDYGLCQSCDEPIHHKRLEFDPTASLCIQCAEKAENPE
ncbi:MAG: TraR/DksA family transcriptional regulator [Gammaproteobacteria bacterium]|nr:TraR/DksA family transcriptional regulator [Gammaproteobacteria bacterium]